ncbi:type III secretion system export apparatus subunit SctT, partial [Escherichia coli]|uniref:type III secretion system export apparatus subunit SctT n=1 Tax=Escherichia coli TaxID=562 RepID=UPI00201A341D
MYVIYSGALASARIAPIFYLLPFLNTGYLTGSVRMPVMILIAVSVWPFNLTDYNVIKEKVNLISILFEVCIGFILGILLSLPFWIFQAVGAVCDNQRGSMMSSVFDPTTGTDTPELARLFNLFACVIYLHNGGMVYLVDTVTKSYYICMPFEKCKISIPYLFNYLNYLVKQTILISSPVVGVLLCVEVFLGLLSRFASQLNAFSVLLSVKTFAAICIILLYFTTVSSA